MKRQVGLRGGTFDTDYLRESVREARSHRWEQFVLPEGHPAGHVHCLVCWTAVWSDSQREERIALRSEDGLHYLCGDCHEDFVLPATAQDLPDWFTQAGELPLGNGRA
jgi:hypothetical protein